MKYKTTLTAKAHLLEPDSDRFKAVAEKVEKYGLVIQPQMDLLYIESCLVSAGNKAGINDNDDIFTTEETWSARCTPVLKPLNWQHNDKDIVGVMYTVQARDLNGNILDLNQKEYPTEDFDLWTEAVIFKFINPERAHEVETRTRAGNLYVSMEAWFDDYSYGMCDESGVLSEIVSREKSTAFLDQHLRAYKGSGAYEGKRIGRVLRSITFGGCGLVDRPANKRSEISQVSELATADTSTDLINWFSVINKEMNDMNAQANQVDPKKVINDVLDEREDKRAKAEAQRVLQARANELEANTEKLEQQVNTLTQTLQNKESEVKTLNERFDAFNEVIQSLVTTVKGSAADVLVDKIDSAKYDANQVFKAKLEFIKQTAASLVVANTELGKAAMKIREQEVSAMFTGLVEPDTLSALVAKAQKLSAEDYADWKIEKELFALELKAAKKPFPPKEEDKMKELVKDKKEKAELTNHPGGEDIKSGVNPGQLRKPRFQIAGSAGDELAEALEGAQPSDSANLAGAEAGNDEQENTVAKSFKALAMFLTENEEDLGDSPKED